MEDYAERMTAVGRTRVEDAATAIQQVQDDMSNAEKAGLMTTKDETTVEEMLHVIGDGLSDVASSDDEDDGEEKDDDQDDPAGGKVTEDDEPGWEMGTTSKTVQYNMECFRQTQMKLDKFTQPGWGDAADYFRERDEKYGTIHSKVPVVI